MTLPLTLPTLQPNLFPNLDPTLSPRYPWSEGVLGKYLRLGQSEESGACGAVLAAYDSACQCGGEQGPFDMDDMQQSWLKKRIGDRIDEIEVQGGDTGVGGAGSQYF